MILLRRAKERGHAHEAWLDRYETFSPKSQDAGGTAGGFRALRVINEDVAAGGADFGMHPHRDLEILTYVLSGALLHRDNLGHLTVMKAGEIQRITAGSGIEHSEANYSRTEPVHLLQAWIAPEALNLAPDFRQKSFVDTTEKVFTLVASREGREDSIPINQDVDVLLGRLNGGGAAVYPIRPGRGLWVQVTDGQMEVNGAAVSAGDGLGLSGEEAAQLTPQGPASFLMFDLK